MAKNIKYKHFSNKIKFLSLGFGVCGLMYNFCFQRQAIPNFEGSSTFDKLAIFRENVHQGTDLVVGGKLEDMTG
jgi:hypothetical protein